MHIQEYTAKIDKKIFEIITRVTTTATHFFFQYIPKLLSNKIFSAYCITFYKFCFDFLNNIYLIFISQYKIK